MKKSRSRFIAIVLLGISSLLISSLWLGTKPFRHLSPNDITAATVELTPLGVQLTLNRQELAQLAALLATVVTYQKDSSFDEYAGQMVTFNITKANGESLKIQAHNPFVIINGVGYRTKYEPCEALNKFANQLSAVKQEK